MSESLISVVVPVLNEEEVLREFYERLAKALDDVPFEVIFIDDGSTDDSWKLIEELASKDDRLRGVNFSRNFGHQAALTAGLERAKGATVVIIDGDLQDPPELIPEMIKKWKEGYDVVYGVRSERKGEGILKKMTASLFYRIFRRTSNMEVPLGAGDFRLLSRRVVDALNQIPERVRFLRGLTSWVGFRQIGIDFTRDKRFAGRTKYPFFKMLRFAFDGITCFSTLPLQFSTYLGLFATTVAFLLAIHSLFVRIFTKTAVKGWTSLLIAVVFLGGVQLLMTGIIGEYIGRIYEEAKHRPLYLIQRSIGLEKNEDSIKPLRATIET